MVCGSTALWASRQQRLSLKVCKASLALAVVAAPCWPSQAFAGQASATCQRDLVRRKLFCRATEAADDQTRDSNGSGAAPKAALLLIDFQKAFVEGSWAKWFGIKQVADIVRAGKETTQLLTSGRLPKNTPVLCTKCYRTGIQDEPYLEEMEPFLRDMPWVHKPTMDVTWTRKFWKWLNAQSEAGIGTLVVGGCTTTSCVRVSSQQIARRLPEHGLEGKLRVVVDLDICGARSDNYLPNADKDSVLVRTYGKEYCAGKSAVDLAVFQMRQAGVEVVHGFAWN